MEDVATNPDPVSSETDKGLPDGSSEAHLKAGVHASDEGAQVSKFLQTHDSGQNTLDEKPVARDADATPVIPPESTPSPGTSSGPGLAFKKTSKIKSASLNRAFLSKSTSNPAPVVLKPQASNTERAPSSTPPPSGHVSFGNKLKLNTNKTTQNKAPVAKSPNDPQAQSRLSTKLMKQPASGNVWGKSQTANHANLTDEELGKVLGIHLTQRLDSTEQRQNRWEDLDDDDDDADWGKTIEFADGTRIDLDSLKAENVDVPLTKTDTVPQAAIDKTVVGRDDHRSKNQRFHGEDYDRTWNRNSTDAELYNSNTGLRERIVDSHPPKEVRNDATVAPEGRNRSKSQSNRRSSETKTMAQHENHAQNVAPQKLHDKPPPSVWGQTAEPTKASTETPAPAESVDQTQPALSYEEEHEQIKAYMKEAKERAIARRQVEEQERLQAQERARRKADELFQSRMKAKEEEEEEAKKKAEQSATSGKAWQRDRAPGEHDKSPVDSSGLQHKVSLDMEREESIPDGQVGETRRNSQKADAWRPRIWSEPKQATVDQTSSRPNWGPIGSRESPEKQNHAQKKGKDDKPNVRLPSLLRDDLLLTEQDRSEYSESALEHGQEPDPILEGHRSPAPPGMFSKLWSPETPAKVNAPVTARATSRFFPANTHSMASHQMQNKNETKSRTPIRTANNIVISLPKATEHKHTASRSTSDASPPVNTSTKGSLAAAPSEDIVIRLPGQNKRHKSHAVVKLPCGTNTSRTRAKAIHGSIYSVNPTTKSNFTGPSKDCIISLPSPRGAAKEAA